MDGYVKWPAAAALACVTALGLLALLVYAADSFQHLDLQALTRISAHHHSWSGEGAEAISRLGDPAPLLMLLAAACAVAFLRGRPSDALAAAVVVAGANITTQALKLALSHPRTQALLGGSGGAEIGFPSGHTTSAFSIAIALAFVVPRRLVPVALTIGAGFGAAVGFSVVVISWHYPSDVIGGILVAAGWGFAVLASTRAVEPRERSGAGLSAPGPLPSR